MWPEPGSAEAWMEYAQSDLALAKQTPPPGVLRVMLCFHAQQAAEKAVKAVLIHHGVEFPRTHSIARLMDLVPPAIPRTPALLAADRLTAYATVVSYPYEKVTVSEQDYREALDSAQAVFVWAEGIVREGKRPQAGQQARS
jgi:HEPN domain-containing protein